MCLVLLPTSLANILIVKLRHGFQIPELHCHLLHTVFCIGHNFKTITNGEILGTPTQCHTFVLYDDIGQKTRLN